jgi:hypothetical protein
MVESVPTISRLMQQIPRISHGRRRLAFTDSDPPHAQTAYIHISIISM